MRLISVFATAAIALGLSACGGPSFESATPRGFVELEEAGRYDYRATTPDGLVIAAREIDHEPTGEIAFWERAIVNEMRQRGGYALVDAKDVKDANGLAGRQLRFGHDEGKVPHLYVVTLFVTSKKIVLVEMGGTKELVERHAADIDWTIEQFRAKKT